jgi:hypothetical protein
MVISPFTIAATATRNRFFSASGLLNTSVTSATFANTSSVLAMLAAVRSSVAADSSSIVYGRK